MLPASGQATARAKPSATAASTALPPAFMISAAAALASGLLLTAIACAANVEDAPVGRRQPAGNCAGSRAGSALPSVGGVVVRAQAPNRQQESVRTIDLNTGMRDS
jgi:hypothetical protein